MPTFWAHRYSQAASRTKSSAIRELLKLTEDPEVISFAGGCPAPEGFPTAEFEAAAARVMKEHGAAALQYSATEGDPKLRAMLARHAARYGVMVEPDHILLTTGSQQALDLIGKVFLNAGDRVLLERPTYLGALQAWSAYGADYVTLDMDGNGMETGGPDRALRSGPKFIYALPNFQNPTGVTLSPGRRRVLVDAAERYGVPIVEDDPYGQLRYEGEHLPSLAALDARRRRSSSESGNVLYLSTFSKILAPGLRLGWIAAPREVIERLVAAKQGADLHTSTFVQHVVYELAREGFLDRHVRRLRSLYRERRDAMLAAMERCFPAGVSWTRPQGGLFIWVTLPPWMDATEALHLAILEKVAFVPGSAFYSEAPLGNTLRLNFSNPTPERIEEGIRRLGFVLSRVLELQGRHTIVACTRS